MSTTVYPNLSRELAMKIGKERRIDRIVRSDFDSIIGVPKKLVSRSINNIASKLKGVFETYPENEILSDHSVFLSKLAVEAMPRIKRITDEKIS